MDFVHVMKDWRRMCQHMEKEYGNRCCDHCPLDGCYAVYGALSNENFLNMEHDIVAWSTEHPESIYPRWCDWLAEQGVLVSANSFPNMRYWYTMDMEKMEQPIPANIAKKLGIEPKEN